MIIDARAKSMLSFRFDVLADQEMVGSFRHKLGKRSSAVVGSLPCEISRVTFHKWDLVPEGGGSILASVEKAPKGRYDISWPEGKIALIRSFLGFRWEIADLSGLLGSVRLNNLFTRSLRAEIADGVPDRVAVLLMWTVVMLRRKTAAAAAGGGSA